jgi:hypothetical protein
MRGSSLITLLRKWKPSDSFLAEPRINSAVFNILFNLICGFSILTSRFKNDFYSEMLKNLSEISLEQIHSYVVVNHKAISNQVHRDNTIPFSKQKNVPTHHLDHDESELSSRLIEEYAASVFASPTYKEIPC